ncbi:MAG: hypothetical protein ACOCYO_02275 [Bacteroidota bacterium]
MKRFVVVPFVIFLFLISSCSEDHKRPVEVRGWNILSDHFDNALEVIEASKDYQINHLELSHHLIMDLQHVKTEWLREKTNQLIDSEHKAGIKDVFVWDRAFYQKDYYPGKFMVDSVHDRRLNLDDPEFWKWFREDYREMFALIPDVDGIVFTFIETGSPIRDQFSENLNDYQKMAMVVDSVADIVINELGKKMHIRTFIHDQWDKDVILGSLNYINHPDLKIMVKETPHDFFNFHPVQDYVADLKYPVIIEFDAAHEYNGQGIVANTFTQLILDRWKYYMQYDHVIGYVARTDRYGTTKIINRPSEVLLYALHRAAEDTTITEDQVLDEFIGEKYGKQSIPFIKPAFKAAIDINNSSFYTLGTNTTDHSALNIDYISSYNRFVAGRWYDPPLVYIGHNVNKEFHYFKDVVEHLSPKKYKNIGGRFYGENPEVFEKNWVSYEEKMDTTYLEYILTEKDFAVETAKNALESIEKSEPFVEDQNAFKDLYETFNRTLITAKLHRATHKIYFGYRIYVQDTTLYKETIVPVIAEGMQELRASIKEIEEYPYEVPSGQWTWHEPKARMSVKMSDLDRAKTYIDFITKTGWPSFSEITLPDL